MSCSQEIISWDIPPYVTDYSSYFDMLKWVPEGDAHGGFADIFSNSLGKQKYALKVLRPWSRGEAAMKKNFDLELSSWIKLGPHPNILHLVGICYTTLTTRTPQPSFLSYWQDNGRLNDYLRENADVNLLEILNGVLSGLEHMHGRGVIHGDLRGGNILVSNSGVPQIADFGLSKIVGQESSSSHCSGTIRWMAKELLDADHEDSGTKLSSRRSRASDVWSMGMTILELLSGRKPYYDCDNVIPIISQGTKPKFPGVLHEVWTVYVDTLWRVCNNCWRIKPSERPTVQNLIDEINFLRHSVGLQGNEDPTPDESSPTPRARPQRDTAELLARITSLDLNSSTDFGNSVNSRTDGHTEDFWAPGMTMGSGLRSYTHTTFTRSDVGFDVEFDDRALDGCAISYMTAFVNHLTASKRFRKHTVHSEAEGPAHSPTWTVSISLDGIVLGKAVGRTKKAAQDEAARQAFAAIENEEIDPDVPYLPLFLNRLNVRGSRCHAQFRWRTELGRGWSGGRVGEWVSTLYRCGMVGRLDEEGEIRKSAQKGRQRELPLWF
ncbi:kinase-like protein [Fomitiporia mediterranea MF3/22]|uniref:kinase-like protein n=1 Tax=Fomitiporia mediterranea (strain MF3/22) TaxID=694068 RepID=UPI0004407B9D|nr:kinase-like protein [Fomitiporia mediterranea MF3/22]EJD00428.1 kinase-like protein [Fomitiporia mediterranea MF3/22]